MKNLFKARTALFLGITVLAAVIMLSMTACGDPEENGPAINVPSVNQLPAFPEGSTPAATKEEAENVLSWLKGTRAIQKLNREIDDVVHDYFVEKGLENERRRNFNFNNRVISGGNVSVSANQTYNISNTGGFKAQRDLVDNRQNMNDDDYEETMSKIQYAVGDRYDESNQERGKGELKSAIDYNHDWDSMGSVTVASGSMFELIYIENYEVTVAKAGTTQTALFNYNMSGKEQYVIGFTVVTGWGHSVKIVFDMNGDYDYTESEKESGMPMITEKYKVSGSLKVYGADNALLINHPINDENDAQEAFKMIGFRDENW